MAGSCAAMTKQVIEGRAHPYLIASTTGPETGSVVPRPLPSSSSAGRKRSRVAIICGRPAARASWLSYSATRQ